VKRIAIIGAGAAGCFCAINLKRICPEAEVIVLEATHSPLAKVSITGGGRCNLTNSFKEVQSLSQVYPRGDKLMKRMFCVLSPEETQQWWKNEGVKLTTQKDQCVFPQSQDAKEIVNTLLTGMERSGVKLWTNTKVKEIKPAYTITLTDKEENFDFVVITTGGCPSKENLSFLSPLNLPIEHPVPSLFTVNIPDKKLHTLMGTVVENASVSIPGTKFKTSGPLLITHWGMSGPSILKLTSHAARFLYERDYNSPLAINWMGQFNEEQTRNLLCEYRTSQKQIPNFYPTHLSQRHWIYLLERSGISLAKRWNALNQKETNRLLSHLTADLYHMEGKSRYKDEFVTCGGVSLSCINLNTLESKQFPGLYFAGEVLDVDAVTGGFNLQAAWSMGYCVAQSLKKRIET